MNKPKVISTVQEREFQELMQDPTHEYYSSCGCGGCERVRSREAFSAMAGAYPVMIPQYRADQQTTRTRMGVHQLGRTLAGADVNTPLSGRNSYQHRAIQDTGYVAREGEPFVRRASPKIRGKAARRADKAARRNRREQHQDESRVEILSDRGPLVTSVQSATPNTEIGT